MPSIPVFVLIGLPWLNPVATGPTPAVVPLLFSWACAALLVGVWGWGHDRSPAGRGMSATAWAWLVAGLVSSLIGLCQYFGGANHFSPWMNQTAIGEAFANLRQRNQFATLTSISLAALLWLVVTPDRFAGRRRWLMLAIAGLLAAGNAASSSRTGLLQLGLLLVLWGVWGGLRHVAVRPVLLVAVVTYVLAALVLPWLAGFDLVNHGMFARLQTDGQLCASRVTLWTNVLQLIAQKPWWGWGWGELDYAHYMTLYSSERFCDILDNAHNLPLHLAVELGIPVAALVCAGFLWALMRAKPWRETDPARQMAWGVLAVILLHSMLEYPLWYGPFQVAVGLCLVLLWRPSLGDAADSKVPPLLACSARACLAAALLVGTGYAAFDYHRISQIYLAPTYRSAAYREDTLNKIRGSWLFQNQVRFAELSTTALTRDNAQWTHATAAQLLHYSPEPRVIEKMIESAVMLGRDEEAMQHLMRYRAAFPQDYEKWRSLSGLGPLSPR